MTYRSNVPRIIARLRPAIDAGLVAAVEVPMARTAEDLARGFTSGVFTTGESAESVRRVEPYDSEGGRAIAYGSDLIHQLWWSVGAFSSWTRRFERVDKWTPHFYGSRVEMLSAFQSAFKATAKL